MLENVSHTLGSKIRFIGYTIWIYDMLLLFK